MLIICLDDEQMLLDSLMRSVAEAAPNAEIIGYRNVSQAIEEIRTRKLNPDIAFLDIEMPGLSGLELAKILKISCPKINIVFVTGFSEYAVEAFAMRASGYVMKPVTAQKISTELVNLQNPPQRQAPSKPIKIQCFGNFEIFVNGTAVKFGRAKSKEIIAYLVDRRGSFCTAAEIAAILWEDGVFDRSRQKQLQMFKSDMMKALKAVNIENLVNKTRDGIAVNTAMFDCDYYMALQGDTVAINSFSGEYMSQYEWAEYTTGALSRQIQ